MYSRCTVSSKPNDVPIGPSDESAMLWRFGGCQFPWHQVLLGILSLELKKAAVTLHNAAGI
jgi:hypothetical protein